MIHRNLAVSLAMAGVYLGGAFALKYVERAGLLSPETSDRAFGVFIGLTLAVYANFLPKSLGNFRNPASALRMEQVLRVSGWAYMLGGLGYALTSVLPLPDAVPIALLGTATAYVLGYSAWAFLEHGPGKSRPT
ncbi:hypothetical protein [Phenylobacterium sp.]|uniref:hypothetical protein n=1 Tax=Phenylobacterium sp. TaxID=1871053 RepID=UPI001221B50E|nr:hypothetical protein [Phenylobacterium sp.]THD70603.1 MAG: hypothetical protein E8A12_02805 [Phenylobacterium sp.]